MDRARCLCTTYLLMSQTESRPIILSSMLLALQYQQTITSTCRLQLYQTLLRRTSRRTSKQFLYSCGMASASPSQPPWKAPIRNPQLSLPNLKILNSLTRQKDAFVPIDPAGKTVTFYACGPTPYGKCISESRMEVTI